MFNFTDQVVFVTGASGNLGRAVALAFAQAGAHLALVGRKESRVREVLPELANKPETLITTADLTDADSVHTAVSVAHQHFGHIDVLANTIGGYKAGTAIHETPLSTWDAMLALNVRSAFLISRTVVTQMLAQRHGHIIHIASRAGLKAGREASAYAASKSAVIRLTESLAAEYKMQGIHANCVLPGIIDTPQNRAAMPDADFSKWVTPEAIANVILFLASEASSPIHGAAIPVYGLS